MQLTMSGNLQVGWRADAVAKAVSRRKIAVIWMAAQRHVALH
jgi:hypothetical protein